MLEDSDVGCRDSDVAPAERSHDQGVPKPDLSGGSLDLVGISVSLNALQYKVGGDVNLVLRDLEAEGAGGVLEAP